MWFASSTFVLVVIALLFVILGIFWWRHSHISNDSQAVGATNELSQVYQDIRLGVERFVGAAIHYQMREAVDRWGYLRSEKFYDFLKSLVVKIEPEYHAVIFYQLRWLHDGYPGPNREVCARNQEAGGKLIFRSIGAGLRPICDPERLPAWAAETEGAFLRAKSLDEMRDVAMHYPLLLRPGVQGGIDVSIEHLSEPDRSAYFGKLRHLQRLREEIEGHPIESWWRPIDRQYGGHIAE